MSITVRITVPKNLDETLHAQIYTLLCPACDKMVAQLSSETTAINCKWCKKPMADIKGMIEMEACRIAWHGMKPPSWEIY